MLSVHNCVWETHTMKKNPEREIPFVPDATRNKMIKQGKNGETFVITCVESEFQNQILFYDIKKLCFWWLFIMLSALIFIITKSW